jgi:hypothetical protein
MTSKLGNIGRSYRPLCLEAVFGEQLLDICFKTPLPDEASPTVVGSVNDDPRCAVYASLFAAAPELLEALQTILAQYKEGCISDDAFSMGYAALRKAGAR